MKLKIYLPLLLLLVLIAGACVKSNVGPTTPLVIPSGTFTGKFSYFHRKTDNIPYDTLTSNIILTMTGTAGTYAVTGDTTTLHAGSFGSFQINSNYLSFADKTFPLTGIPKKIHLSGVYLYQFDGTNLVMVSGSSDTLGYTYQLTKTN
jgi:hypothetical protein